MNEFMEEGFSGLKYSHDRQQKLVELLLLFQKEDGVCSVAPSLLAEKMKLSEAMVNKILNQLQKCGNCVEIVRKGRYIVNKKDLKLEGPWSKVVTLMYAVMDDPAFVGLSQAEQLDKLGFSLYELQMAKAFMLQAAGKQRSAEAKPKNLQIPVSDIEQG